MIKIWLIIILFQFKKNGETLQVDWSYSDLKISDLNSPECGLSSMPIIYELPFEGKCFKNNYKNKTIAIFDIELKQKKKTARERIHHGQDAILGEAGFVAYVRLQYDWPYSDTKCTGVLITLEWVLTAAKCFDNWIFSRGTDIVVSAGGTLRESTNTRQMHKYFIHPIYKDPKINTTRALNAEELKIRKKSHDIAIIKVSPKFKRVLTEDHRYWLNTICLPKYSKNLTLKSNMSTFYGHGDIDFQQHEATHLQKGQIQLDIDSQCPDYSFCGSVPPEGPKICKGDNGGPLVQTELDKSAYRAILIGITRGFKKIQHPRFDESKTFCDQTIVSGNFTSVVSHINWILEVMKTNK